MLWRYSGYPGLMWIKLYALGYPFQLMDEAQQFNDF